MTVLHKGVTAIKPKDVAARPDPVRQLDCRITKSATDIKDIVAFLDLKCRKDGFAVMGQPVNQNVLLFDKFWDKNLIPKINELYIAL